jgi:signal transduction histidine kinase
VTQAPDVSAEDLLLDGRVRLEDLIDRDGLDELCKSFVLLFGIPVRIYSNDGALLADAAGQQELCAYVNSMRDGRKACAATVAAVKARDPGDAADVVHACFSGASYRIFALEYDRRRVGRLIVGPFLSTTVTEPPSTLLTVDPALEKDRATTLLFKMPRAKPDTITRIAGHLKASLDLILFSGHKAFVTSRVHLASVREGYRQLEDKAARLQEAFDRLKELDHLKSNFLATVSHELRTPLTSIIGYSEMLAEGLAGDMKPEQLEFVRTIQDKGGQLLSLIMGLLDVGKLESGTMRFVRRTLAVGPVLDEVVSTLAPAARKKGVALQIDVAPGLPFVRGDAERLRQVFLNLVENAIKFTPAGGNVLLQARLVGAPITDVDEEGLSLLAPTRSRIEVRVVDTGIGIAPRERTKVFDAFYQVDSSSTRQHGGAGLGLSIAKRLVEGHGGEIHVEDNEPNGAVFIVSLPQQGQSQAPGSA